MLYIYMRNRVMNNMKKMKNEEEVTKKRPNNYAQKYHPEDHIIGSKDGGVQTRRKNDTNNEKVNFFLLTEMEQKNYTETSKNEK